MSEDTEEEFVVAKDVYRKVYTGLVDATFGFYGDCLIGRYSVLPFYREVELEVRRLGSRLVNSWEQHQFVADVTQYAEVLGDLTPKTYSEWYGLPEGAYVVKGRTNSRKHLWNTHMFAPTVADVPRVAERLLDDQFIGSQGLVVREYVPLRKLDEGINGLPVTNEWRVFVLDGKPFAKGFYWSTFPECEPKETPPESLLAAVAERLAQTHSAPRFYAVDVAERADGGWIVVELNDGQMSGLSCIDPKDFYEGLLTATQK